LEFFLVTTMPILSLALNVTLQRKPKLTLISSIDCKTRTDGDHTNSNSA